MGEAFSIIQNKCLKCHTEEKQKGGLRLDSLKALLKGGETAPAIVPGNSENSFLIETLFPDSDPHMPPKGQLDPKEISVLERWIDQDAPWDQQKWEEMRTLRHRQKVELASLPGEYRPVQSVALSRDGKMLAAGIGNRVAVFEVLENAKVDLVHSLEGHRDVVQSLAWSPDGKRLASGGFRKLMIWFGESGFALERECEEGLAGRITAMEFSPDSRTVVAADSVPSGSALLHWLNVESGDLRTLEPAHDDTIFDLEISPDGKLLATASADKLVHLRRADSGELAGSLEGHTGYVLALAFGPRSQRIATSGDDAMIKVWDIATRKQISSFGGNVKATGPVTGLAWMEDPDKAKQKAGEKDPKKAAEINADIIIAATENGRPTKYTDLVEHEGAERSSGARGRDFSSSEKILCGVALNSASSEFYSGSTDGELLMWDKNGKLQVIFQPGSKPSGGGEAQP